MGPLGVFALLGGGCIRDVLSGTEKNVSLLEEFLLYTQRIAKEKGIRSRQLRYRNVPYQVPFSSISILRLLRFMRYKMDG